jgi:hypothetical protein
MKPTRESKISLRMKVRRGELQRTERPDPNGSLEAREPDELLFDLIGEEAALVPKSPRRPNRR